LSNHRLNAGHWQSPAAPAGELAWVYVFTNIPLFFSRGLKKMQN